MEQFFFLYVSWFEVNPDSKIDFFIVKRNIFL